MKLAGLVAQRMSSLRLNDSTRSESVLDAVRWMGALQAQDFENGLWAIGVRTKNSTRAMVEAAIARREIVRTWSMRGTWHFIPAADVCWMQDLLASRALPAIRKHSANFGLDEALVARCRNVVVKALEGGHSLSREELVRRIAESGSQIEGQIGNHLLRRFGNEGLLCNGAAVGREPAFALRDEWVAKPVRFDREAALAEIALRYFRSHGPATLQDFVWWTGLPASAARAGIASIGKALSRCLVSERDYWFMGEQDAARSSDVELLPAFDEHLLGYQDRRAVLDDKWAANICPGGNGIFRSTIVVKGRVAGLWKRKDSVKNLVLEIMPFETLSPTVRRRIESSARHLSTFYEKPVIVRFS